MSCTEKVDRERRNRLATSCRGDPSYVGAVYSLGVLAVPFYLEMVSGYMYG